MVGLLRHAFKSYDQFERHEVALHSLIGLLRVANKKARTDTVVLHRYLVEFKKENYTHITEFGKIINELLTDLEDVKKYARKQEHKDISGIYTLLTSAIKIHFTTVQPSSLQKETEKLLEEISDELSEEIKREKRIAHHRSPKGTVWNRLIHGDKGRARERIENATHASILEDKESDAYDKSYALIHYISSNPDKDTIHQKQMLIKYMALIINLITEEFSYVHDIQVDAAVQEFTLITQMEALEEQVRNKDLLTILKDFDARFALLIDADRREAKNMRKTDLPKVASVRKMINISRNPPVAELKNPKKPSDTQTSLDAVLTETIFFGN